MKPQQDSLHRFLVEDTGVRGELVHLDETWRALLSRCDYPPTVRDLLGQALSAAALLAATIKFNGSLTLQISGNGPLRMMVVQSSSDGTVRGLARWKGKTKGYTFEQLLGQATLAITIDPGPGKDRFQSIIDTDGAGLADVLQSYFDRSEQLPTRLWLAADTVQSAGLLLQRVPGADDEDESWSRITARARGLQDYDLLRLPARELLTGLRLQEDVRLFAARPIKFRCRCSRGRVRDMLEAIGEHELEETLANQGKLQVDCEFCRAVYEFDAVDLGMIFTPSSPSTIHPTRH